MPTRQGTADFLRPAPAFAYGAGNHGQPTFTPPPAETAGRPLKSKGKRRPRQERTSRPDEDMRFNVGPPRVPRTPAARRAPRVRQNDPNRREEDDIFIPDEPPPSFQEAISMPQYPPHSTSTANTSHPPRISITIPNAIPDHSEGLQSASPSLSPIRDPRSLRSSLAVNEPTSPSESSLEIVDMEPSQTEFNEDRRLGLSLEECVKREWMRRKASFGPPSSPSSRPTESQSMYESRGHHSERPLLDTDGEAVTLPSTPVSMKSKLLSPLRALSASPRGRDRNRPSSPTLPSSPYSSLARSTTALIRSTTSLGRFPMPSTSASLEKSDSTMSRRRFASKGKEKTSEPSLSIGEVLDMTTWEMIDSRPTSFALIEPALSMNNEGSAIQDTLPQPVPPQASSSQRSAAFPSLATTISPDDALSTASKSPVSSPTQQTFPSATMAFLNRTVRRAGLPTAPSSLSVSTLPESGSASPATSPSSPMSRESPYASAVSLSISAPKTPSKVSWAPVPGHSDRRGHVAFHPALEVPLPPSPCEVTPRHSDVGSPRTRVQVHASPAWGQYPSIHDSLESQTHWDRCGGHFPPQAAMPFGRGHHDVPFPSSPASTVSSAFTKASSGLSPSAEYPIRPGRHYVGRPLPRPPPTFPLPAGAQATHAGYSEGLVHSEPDRRTPLMAQDQSGPSRSPLTRPLYYQNQPPQLQDSIERGGLTYRAEEPDRVGLAWHPVVLVAERAGPVSVASAPQTPRPPMIKGQITLDRHRVDSEGHVQLKVTLLDGAMVEECAICLTYFKEGQWGLLPECQHAFHDSCFGKWLENGQICQICRRRPPGEVADSLESLC